MEELKRTFPPDVEYKIVYDTTPFITESIHEVFKALRDAIILVAIVVLAFLQSWRATIIPLIAVPVAIVGTFAVMLGLGFSLNNLSLFGLVLAIGIVVDDAIVVVEAVEHHLEHGLPPKEAARRAMSEVAGPIIAISLVLMCVFVPCAFITGITGQFFRQFALTIAVSTFFSAVNSLTLSPALCALLLKAKHEQRDPLTWVLNRALGWFFKLFNRGFETSANLYARSVGILLRVSVIVLIVYGGLLYLTYFGFTRVPTGFIPSQDKGYLLVDVRLPDSASLERTSDVMTQIEKIALGDRTKVSTAASTALNTTARTAAFMASRIRSPFPGNRSCKTLSAPTTDRFMSSSTNLSIAMAATLAPMPSRRNSALPVTAKCRRRRSQYSALQQLMGWATPAASRSWFAMSAIWASIPCKRPPTISPPTAMNNPVLWASTVRFVRRPRRCTSTSTASAAKRWTCRSTKCSSRSNSIWAATTPTISTSSAAPGRLICRATRASDLTPDQVRQLKVRNAKGEMVPLGSVAHISPVGGPALVVRYNGITAAAVNGGSLPGISSGIVIKTIDRVAQNVLPQGMDTQWTELTLLQILAGNTAIIVFALAVVLVFLVLAAQYESLSLPLAVILVVPMCLLCSTIGVALAHLDINIFVQIGFIVLVGLASKNAILIVEFAKEKSAGGAAPRDAAVEACRLRLRPIIMTSMAFILGVLPLALAVGAGAEMRRTLGIAVFSGMLGVTLFGIFLTPVFYYVVVRLFGGQPASGLGTPPTDAINSNPLSGDGSAPTDSQPVPVVVS